MSGVSLKICVGVPRQDRLRQLLQCRCPDTCINSLLGGKDVEKGTDSSAQQEKLKSLDLRFRLCSTNTTIVNVP